MHIYIYVCVCIHDIIHLYIYTYVRMCVCVCAFSVNNHSSDVAGFGHYNLSKMKCYYWQLGIHRCLGKSDCWR